MEHVPPPPPPATAYISIRRRRERRRHTHLPPPLSSPTLVQPTSCSGNLEAAQVREGEEEEGGEKKREPTSPTSQTSFTHEDKTENPSFRMAACTKTQETTSYRSERRRQMQFALERHSKRSPRRFCCCCPRWLLQTAFYIF